MKNVLSLIALGCIPLASAAMQEGTVQKLEIEGGCWIVVTDKGERLEPVNLGAEFLRPGLRIAFESRSFAGGTICMAGRPVEVFRVVRREEKSSRRP